MTYYVNVVLWTQFFIFCSDVSLQLSIDLVLKALNIAFESKMTYELHLICSVHVSQIFII